MKYIGQYLKNLWFIVLGYPAVAIAIPFNKGLDHFKWPWFERIWGNEKDTIRGDDNWRMYDSPGLGGIDSWRNVWVWSAWRNPAKQYHREHGISGTVEKITMKGTWGKGKAEHIVVVDGVEHTLMWSVTRHPIFRSKVIEKMVGPKIWPTVIEFNPDGTPKLERPLRVGDTIEQAAIAARIRGLFFGIKVDWDLESVAAKKAGLK